MNLDISTNRSAAKIFFQRKCCAACCGVLAKLFFRFSPATLFPAGGRFILHFVSVPKIGSCVNFYPSTIVYFPRSLTVGDWRANGEDVLIYNLGKVTLGVKVTQLSDIVRVLPCAGTHDYAQPDLPLLKLPIEIKDQAWICADAFVGPNVVVGEGAVIGARAGVVKDVGSWTVVSRQDVRRDSSKKKAN